MGGQRDIVEARQRVVRIKRLDVKHVETGMADAAARQSVNERGLVDQRGARGVDEDDARSHARELGFTEMTSDRAKSSSSATSGASGRGDRFQAITSMPSPRPIRRTSLPMPPSPITPSVLPRS